MIPREAADAITASCRIERLDLGRIREGIGWTSQPLMPLIVELGRVVGEPHGGWVLLPPKTSLRPALADLAERSAEMVMARRTHGQHAVPITFGLKVASWIDEIGRHTPAIAFEAIKRSSILIGEALERVYLIIGGLRLNPQRMRSNLDLSGGMIGDEAIILELGKTIGRQLGCWGATLPNTQLAHDVVYEAAQAAASQNISFTDRLAADHCVTAYLSPECDPWLARSCQSHRLFSEDCA